MFAAKRKEITNLLARGTFEVIDKNNIPPYANVLPGKFVLTLKSSEAGSPQHKARYVIGGHRDRMKKLMVHTSQTLQPSSIRLLLAVAALFAFDVWTSDVRQAYLQSTEPLSREIYIRNPAPEFLLEDRQALKVLKPLYALCDSGDLWHSTLDHHHPHDLKMTPKRTDPALYLKSRDGEIEGISGTYVDDFIRIGRKSFRTHADQTGIKFDMAETQETPCTFTGFRLLQGPQHSLIMHQDEYISFLRPLPLESDFSSFSSLRMKLAWLTHTRPDCAFVVSQLAQVTQDKFKTDHKETVKICNNLLKHLRNVPVKLKFHSLDRSSVFLLSFQTPHSLGTPTSLLSWDTIVLFAIHPSAPSHSSTSRTRLDE